MKILINAINLSSAGTATTGRALFETLAAMDAGHHFIVVVPQGGGLRPAVDVSHIDWLESAPWRGSGYLPWRLWFDFIELPRLARRHGVDAVFALGNHLPGKYLVPGIVLYRNPHYVERDNVLSLAKRMEKRLFARTVARKPAFIAQTAEMKRRLMETWDIAPESIDVVPNGIAATLLDTAAPRNGPVSNDGVFRLVYVSRFYPHKNHQYLVELARELKDARGAAVQIRCTVDPNSSPGRQLSECIDRAGVAKVIQLIGELPVDEINAEYARADAMIFPSKMETFGNPLLEAMAHGVPVIVANEPYAHEICGDAAFYFSLDGFDEARTMIAAIREDIEMYRAHSRKGVERLGSFRSWEQVARDYLSIIEETKR